MRRAMVLLLATLVADPLGAQITAVPVSPPLEHPWAVAWLPDTTMLVTERAGRLWAVREGRAAPVAGVPRVATGGQGGLFDVLVLPATEGPPEILLSYAWEDVGGRSLRVSRATLTPGTGGWRLGGLRPLFDLLPRSAGPIQYGGRLALLPDGTLLIATGDRGDMPRAQVPNDGAGKIHRINLDGSVPGDNPFVGQAGWQPSIWSLGHRNIQGLWVDSAGVVWATEHGPQGGDELNLIRPGKNYGWAVITYGVNYGTGTKIGEGVARQGMEQPVLYWKPSIAPSGLVRYEGSRYPGWEGSFFSGALAGQGLSRFRLSTDPAVPTGAIARAQVPASGAPARLVEEQYLTSGALGRLRDVRQGPDGFLYLVTDEAAGRVYRLEPLPPNP